MNASFTKIKINTKNFYVLKTVFVGLLITVSTQIKAQTDTVNQQKTTTDKESFLSKFDAYKASKNISGLENIADHNHYPFPQKVLMWQKELQLNDKQKATISNINKELRRKVNEMNNFLITNERTMDSLFRYKKINNGTLIFYTNRYGLYHGELRNALLQACVKTEAVLMPSQIKKYAQLLQD